MRPQYNSKAVYGAGETAFIMRILSIETSCDETAIAVLEAEGGFSSPQFEVLGNKTQSQIDVHQKYGGVYPTLAKREHSKNLVPVLQNVLNEAGLLSEKSSQNNPSTTKHSNILQNVRMMLEREPELLKAFEEFVPKIEKPDIDYIAVTMGPGLEPALWVGINFAKALSTVWNIPIIPVNHMEGHVFSVLVDGKNMAGEKNLKFPVLSLLISGGHTELVLSKDWLKYEVLGATRDDAVGEAFDKTARLLGLPYPGGPEISKLAEEAESEELDTERFSFPRPMTDSDDYDFSFSGLKTAVRYKIENIDSLSRREKSAIAKEFEDAVVDVLIHKSRKAIREYSPKSFVVGGGVIANKKLRRKFEEMIEDYPKTKLLIPEMALTTDNAMMIGIAGYFRSLENPKGVDIDKIFAKGSVKLGS